MTSSFLTQWQKPSIYHTRFEPNGIYNRTIDKQPMFVTPANYQFFLDRKTVSHAFQMMFQSYAMAFNKQQNRVGGLFQTPFKRVLVNTDKYFNYLIWYIHANAQTHGMVTDFRDDRTARINQ